MNDELYTSKNFTAYSTLANGPIRTEFILDYDDWRANDYFGRRGISGVVLVEVPVPTDC